MLDTIADTSVITSYTNFYMSEGNDVLTTELASRVSNSGVNMGNGDNKILVIGGSIYLDINDVLEIKDNISVSEFHFSSSDYKSISRVMLIVWLT